MPDTNWTIRGSKRDLESLLTEIRDLERQQGKDRLVPEGARPLPVPADPDGPMGQMEWYEISMSIATGLVSSVLYDGIRALVRRFVAAKPNQASFAEKPQK